MKTKKVLRVVDEGEGKVSVYRNNDTVAYNTCTSASELAYELALHAFLGYEVVYDIEI